VVSVRVPGDRSAAAQARRFVRETLGTWGVDGEALEDCQLLVSELVTNAFLHARSAAQVSLEQRAGVLRVAVCDASTTPPRLRDYGPEAVTGRGLVLVDRLARRWGVDTDGAGKCVWFEIDQRTSRRTSERTRRRP
jgi:anti-sigma regulatory factor (Ser/Thr protein kinase)